MFLHKYLRSSTLFLGTALIFSATALSARETVMPKNVEKISASKLPASVKAEGKSIEQVWTWLDNDNATRGYGVFSSTESESKKGKSRRIFVQLYRGANNGTSFKEQRKINDFTLDCQFDVVANFLDESIQIVDEDEDGVSELIFAYDVACTSDVSPNTRKLLVLEGPNKHILRGTTRVDPGDGPLGGDYKPEGFAKEAKLKAFAEKLWQELLGE
jgi:hypothetical protein